MAKKSSNGPPRPANAFMIFRSEARVRYQSEGNQQSGISQLLSLEWNSLTREQKDLYFRKAEVVKAEHAIKYPGYKYNPKSKEQKAAEKEAAKALRLQEAERKRAAKRAKISESSYVPNANQVTYTQAATQAVAPVFAVGPPTPAASEAPTNSPDSIQVPLHAFQDANQFIAPFPAPVPQPPTPQLQIPQPQQHQWLDPALEPAAPVPTHFSEVDEGLARLKRSFDEMEQNHADAPVEDAYASIPLEPMSLTQEDYANLDDFVQSLVLGYPTAQHAQMTPQEDESWSNLILSTTDQRSTGDVFYGNYLTDEHSGVTDQDGAATFDENTDSLWSDQSASVALDALDAFRFGQNLDAPFQPSDFIPLNAPQFDFTAAALDPLEEPQVEMSYLDFTACAETSNYEQPVASTSSAPIPTPQQQFVYNPPSSSSNATRRRVGGEWPGFVTEISSRVSSLSNAYPY